MKRFQGWRPWAFGDVWDRMSPKERRSAFWTDVLFGVGGAALIILLGRIFG